jgi:hypothetical protein
VHSTRIDVYRRPRWVRSPVDVIHQSRNILRGALFVLAAALALVAASTATAASSKSRPACWKVLINDWYDGRIDGTYPIHCYRDALRHLPTDVDTYSSARDDIRQALQQRITQGGKGGGTGGSTSGGSTAGGGSGGGAPSGGGTGGGGGGSGSDGGPVGSAFKATKPASADSVPVPLIVLGGVALLLMAAGLAGFIARRMRTRKLELASAASAPQRPGNAPPDQR